jgi:2',3'-cyclic-nucleotide 2'-phosphodiesterase/3'-nucleotidase
MLMPFLVAAGLALPPADTVHLVLVATVDVHGQATDWDYLRGTDAAGGLIRATSVLDSLRAAYPGRVILVDGGDAITGTPFGSYFTYVAPASSHPVVDAMNTLQYDAATLGEHDFDAGVAALNHRLADARFPIVSGNLRVVGREDTLAFRPYVVIQRAGVRIAVAGFTTPGAMLWNRDQLQGRLRLTRLADAAPKVLPDMRRDADIIVLVAHAGLDEASTYDTTGVGPENGAAVLAAGAVKPDVVVLGHTGRTLTDSVIGGVHFVQPGHDAERLAVVHIDLEQRNGRWTPVRITAQNVVLAFRPVPPAMQRRFHEEHRTVQAWSQEVLGTVTGSMRAASARVEDTPLGQWMTDLLRRRAGADVAAVTILDPAAGLELGEVFRRQVLAVYPQDYTLRAVQISGAQLQAFLERSARHFFVDSTGKVATNRYLPGPAYDIVGGADYVIDLSRPPGDRIRDLKVKGRLVAPTDTLALALSSARLAGLGGYDMLRNAPVIYDQGERIVDLLMDDLHARRLLRPEDFARPHWRIEPAPLAAQARALYVKAGGAVAIARPDPARAPLFGPDPRKIALPLSRGQAGGALGSLVADAYRTALRTDLALVSTSELTADLPAGTITVGGLNAAWPDHSPLQRLHLNGGQALALLEQVVAGGAPSAGISGLTVAFDPKRPAGMRIRSAVLPSGKKLSRGSDYTLTLSETLVRLLNLPTPAGSTTAPEATTTTTFDALQGYLRLLPQPITPPDGARIAPEK